MSTAHEKRKNVAVIAVSTNCKKEKTNCNKKDPIVIAMKAKGIDSVNRHAINYRNK